MASFKNEKIEIITKNGKKECKNFLLNSYLERISNKQFYEQNNDGITAVYGIFDINVDINENLKIEVSEIDETANYFNEQCLKLGDLSYELYKNNPKNGMLISEMYFNNIFIDLDSEDEDNSKRKLKYLVFGSDEIKYSIVDLSLYSTEIINSTIIAITRIDYIYYNDEIDYTNNNWVPYHLLINNNDYKLDNTIKFSNFKYKIEEETSLTFELNDNEIIVNNISNNEINSIYQYPSNNIFPSNNKYPMKYPKRFRYLVRKYYNDNDEYYYVCTKLDEIGLLQFKVKYERSNN